MNKEEYEMKIRRYTPRNEEQCRTVAICIIELKQENQQLKSTLEEIRVYVEDSAYQMSEDATYDLLQIIDRAVNELKKGK